MNPITAKEIIESDDIISKLNDVKGNLEGLRTALQDAAKGEKLKLSEIISTKGMEDAAAKVRVLADAMEALRVAYKENEEMIRNINNASTKEAELRKANAEAAKAEASAKREVIKAERELQRAQQQTATSAEKNAKAEEALKNAIDLLNGEIDVQKLSYNQLSAVYSNLSSRLKNMSAETIQSTEENRKLASTTKLVRDAMNDAQKAMGNYSLNVGRYHTAFDGLGFSIQQVLREIPSAVNISQFFLAISNNIPMVVDQMKLFNAEQANIKKQLGELVEGTKEYMELQSKQMSLGQKLVKSIFSWQTALVGALLLLRKLPEAVEKIKEKFQALLQITLSSKKAIHDINQEIENEGKVGEWLVDFKKLREDFYTIDKNERESWVKSAATELSKFGEAIHNAREAELLFAKDTNVIVEALKIRAKNAAASKLAAQEYEKAINAQIEYDEFKKNLADKYGLRIDEKGNPIMDDVSLWQFVKMNIGYGLGGKNPVLKAMELEGDIKYYNERGDKYFSYYSPQDVYVKKPKGRKEREKHFKDVDYMEREAMEARANMAEGFFEREIEMNQAKYKQEIHDLDEKHQKEQDNIQHNYDILREKYKDNAEKLKMLEEEENKEREKLSENWWSVRISLDQKYALKEQAILDKYEKKNVKERIAEYNLMANEQMKATNIRVTGMDSEMAKNDALRHNIALLNEELLKLYELRKMTWGSEALGDIDKNIQQIQSRIEKTRNGISFNQRTNAKNFSLGDVLSNTLTSKDKITMMKGAGFSDADIEDMLFQGVLGDNFDKLMANTLNGLKTWKDTTIDYIGDIIDAYIQLAEAKAEAAREETETAKEEYEKQKSLMDAGYANSMETAYMEYREKQELQRQAEQEAKQAQKAQQAIDTASQVSSLVTASANIWAQATKAGLLSPVIAGGLLAAMWGSFLVAKAKAMQVANYGDGGYEIMQGGSHASGHDIDLGVNNRNGRRMHVEGGEGLAVISNKAKRRYGHSAIESVINSINNGTFDVKAGELTRVTPMVIARGSSVSLNRVENTLNDIKIGVNKQSYVTANGDIIEIEGSLKRTIHTR